MKFISKVAACAVGLFLLSSANAATPAKPLLKAQKPAAWQVSVVNNTYDDYSTYAAYLPSQVVWNTYLGPYGAPTDEIYYDSGVPNYCFNIVRNYDGLIVYYGCLRTGTVNINPYAAADKQAGKAAPAPIIKITQ